MRKNIFLKSLLAVLASLSVGVSLVSCNDEGSKHPAGAAHAIQGEGAWTLSNNLLTTTFLWKNGGVEFGGLKGPDGTELLQSGGPISRWRWQTASR